MGTHPIFESDFDCLTEFKPSDPTKMLPLVRQSVRALTMVVGRRAMLAPVVQGNMINSVRYMSPNPVTIQEVADRVNYVLSTFDKIDTEKLNLDCRFDKDLGLDSLDATEIALNIEREFGMEITVEQMDLLLTPREVIDFICDVFDVNH